MSNPIYDEAYNKLNKAQKEAVETIDGPVMVVAGPGTGKTQILALRIGNILKKTDTASDSILCLTFTNSGVSAMKKRLEDYIGNDARNVSISTFHSFAYNLIEKHYELLDFPQMPELLTDNEAVFLVDEILHNNDWEYISPRGNPALYFSDLKQLISILKRERISSEEFLSYIEEDIKNLKQDPDSLSTRGESKGKLKKEIEKKIEQLDRTKEVVEFYRLYEEKKKEMSLIDYDDVLEYAVKLVEDYDDVRSDIRENYLYVLVDEHQDSSGVQNSFLKAVWFDVDQPNIFVVGDDRQLIYAFSGASLSYFEEFSHIFGKARLIVLTENYRSTAPILSIADNLLKSSITDEKLNSNRKGDHKIMLSEYSYPRDEIIGAGLYFKEKIKKGMDPNECALLVPKNYNVRSAISILSDMGLPVTSGKSLSLFSVIEGDFFRNVLNIIVDPADTISISKSILDKTSEIPYLLAHNFLKNTKPDKLNIRELISYGGDDHLFKGENPISKWGKKLENWINGLSGELPSSIVSHIGNELLINTSKGSNELLTRVEVVRSFIHLAMLYEEKNKKASLGDFLEYIDRLESYNTHIELAKFGNDNGIKVMTLHKSKGLEYECVWVAHMNEEILMSEKRGGFTLPEKIKEHINKRSIEMAKRELYVAITRAKEFCTLSYAVENYNGNVMEVASIINDLEDIHFVKKSAEETEKELLEFGPGVYASQNVKVEGDMIDDVKKLVQDNYSGIRVSVSMLNNFFECPWKWYFRNFLRLPEVKMVHLSLGTVVHGAIEYILNNKELPSNKEIKDQIKLQFEKEGVVEENELRRLSKDAYEAVENWVKNYYPHLEKEYKSERSVSFIDRKNFPNLTMYGKIDLTEYLPSGEIYVTDFKTGSVKTKGAIEKINEDGYMSDLMRQLAMYSYLLKGERDDIKVTNSRLLFLEAELGDKNSMYQTTVTEEQIVLLKKDIKEYDEVLSSGSFIERVCNFKPYGTGSTECEYCKMAKRLFSSSTTKI
ncbi:MAG: ATP-dependent DNA helicase [Candidatus Paceibacterota bacterium]|jgi:DNA helicase-2/ATP-dependent DNA helicase PcrA